MNLQEILKLFGGLAGGQLPFLKYRSSSPFDQRAQYQSRLDRGETISDDEVMSAPVTAIPPELQSRRMELLIAAAVQAAMGATSSPEGDSAGQTTAQKWAQAEKDQPPRDVKTDLGAINAASAATGADAMRRPKAERPDPKSSGIRELAKVNSAADAASAMNAIVTKKQTEGAKKKPAPSNDTEPSNDTVPVMKPATEKKYPAFYHQKDDAGNTMAELLAARGKGRGSREVRQQIKAWGSQFDAQQKGTAKRPEYVDGDNQTEPAKASVVSQWNERQQDPAAPKGIDDGIGQTLQAVAKTRDGIAQGEPVPAQPAMSTPAPTSEPEIAPPQTEQEPSRASTAVDSMQLGLDTVGVFGDAVVPGLGVAADGANAAISVGRMFTDPQRAGEHAKNAAISTVSMVPFVGDIAKVFKAKRAGKTVGRAMRMTQGGDAAAHGIASAGSPKQGSRLQQVFSQGAGGAQGSGGGNGNGGNRSPIAPPDDDDPSQGAIIPNVAVPSGTTQERDDAKGIEEHAMWSDTLKRGTENVLEFTGAIGKAYLKAAGFVQSLSLMNTGVLALNRDLAQYNGTIGGAYARAGADDIRRDTSKAEALSGPLSDLADAQSELKDNIAAIMVPLQAIGIQTLAEITELVNLALKYDPIFGIMADALTFIANYLGLSTTTQATDWQSFFQDVSDGKFDGKRPDFKGGSDQILSQQDHLDVFGP